MNGTLQRQLSAEERKSSVRARRVAPAVLLLMLAPLGMGLVTPAAADGDPIIPPAMAQLKYPCAMGSPSGIDYRVCFHTPGASQALAGFSSKTYSATVAVWTYKIHVPGTAGAVEENTDVHVPCAVVTANGDTKDPCAGFGTRDFPYPDLQLNSGTWTIVDPTTPGILAYLVQMKVDVMVENWGITDQPVSVVCADPICSRIL